MTKSNTPKSALQQQLEKKLSQQKEKKQPLTKADALRLLHELETHQIELEMQNEELVQSRAEAEEAYRQYTDLYDFAPVGYFTLARDGTISKVNLAGATLLGADAERGKLIKRRLGLFVAQESRPVLAAFLERLTACEGKETCELMFEKKGGEFLWARFEATCFEGGHECRAVLMDITERKLAEEALRAAGQQWQDTFDAIGDSISLIDLEWRVIKHNRATQVLLGKSATEIGGHTCYELMHGSSQPIENCPCQRMKKSKGRETLVLELNGRWLNVTVDPMFDSDGELIGATHIASDITERMLADKALQTSEANLKAIFENSLQSFMLIDKNRTIQSFNGNASKNAKAIFGEEIQRGDSIYKIVSPQEHGSFDENFERALAGETIRVEKMFEVEAGILWFEFHYAPVLTRNEISGVFLSTSNITERKQAEEARKQSEAQYRLLADNMSDVIWLRDLNLNLLYVSPSEEKIRGYTLAELQQFSLDQLLTPASFQAVMELFTNEMPKVLADPTYSMMHTREFEFYRRDGRLHTVESNISLVRDENGKPTAILGQDRDITERKRAEEALRVSEERFRLLANNVPDVIYSLDGEGNIVTVNSSAFERYGYTEQDLKGKSFLGLIHPEDREIVITSFLKAVEEQRKFTHGLQFRLVAKNGIGYWFELNSQARYDSQFQYIGEDGVLRDITERKQVERDLHENEEKFRSLVEQSTDGVILIDEQGMIIEWNQAQSNITGIPKTSALGASFWDIQHQIVTPERRAKMTPEYLKKTYFESYLSGTTDYSEKPRDIEIVSLSGEHKFLQQTAFIVKTEKGRRMGSVTHDITKRKRAEVEVQRMRTDLEAANIELQAALARQEQLAHTDVLTGINNRRRLYELAEHEFEIAMRYQQPLSAIMFDIDHFKKVNDTFGHAVGDQMLQRVTQTACEELRSADIIGRYGGEEFVVILPMTNAQQAHPLAERIREQVAAIRVPTKTGDASVTLSIGIVEIIHGEQTRSVEALIRYADKAMYAAKQAGRNRTEIGEQS